MPRKNIIPEKWEEVGILKSVVIYPLKSGQRMELLKAECTEFGLKQTKDDYKGLQLRDRAFAAYDIRKDNDFCSARTYPKLLQIHAAAHDNYHLVINAPKMDSLYVKIPTKDNTNQSYIKMYKSEKVFTIDCGDEAALWFSRYILRKDSGIRLGYHDGSQRRDITKTHQDFLDFYTNLSNDSIGLYSDLSSILLVNQTSVDDLNSKISNSTITMDNFRPNLVVDGPNMYPYSEDEWEWIKIGDIVLRFVKDCNRCTITTIDPIKSTSNLDREPLKTLGTYRVSNGPEGMPVMGLYLEVRKTGTIQVGDNVFVAKYPNTMKTN